MKIDRIRTVRLGELPNVLYVLIDTDDGATGVGETFIGAEAVESYIHESAAAKLLGTDALAIEAHAVGLRDVLGRNGAGVESRGNSALDIALWDLFGKAVGQPLYQVLGGKVRDRVRIYNTCAGYEYVRGTGSGYGSENWGMSRGNSIGPYDDLRAFEADAGELAQSLLAEGITAMKIWPFDRTAEQNSGQFITTAQLKKCLEPIRLIRDSVGDAIDVMVEFHSFWTTAAAQRIVAATDAYAPFWYEDLLPAYETEALRRISDRTATPLALSETMAGLANFQALFASGAAAIGMADVGWGGGITAGRRIGNLAEAHGMPITLHDCTGPVVLSASTHLSCHLPNGFIQETVRAFYSSWYRDLVTALPAIENGEITPLERAGHGIELNPDLLTRRDATVRTSRSSA